MTILTPERYRREAELAEQAAASISLQSDKEAMLATARFLRLRADGMEPPFDCSPSSAQTGSKPSDTY
jgi:hypothetical protein